MRSGRPKKPFEVADEDRSKLNLIARRSKSSQALATRARIVLSCEKGMNNAEVAAKLNVAGATVGKWRERFRKGGLEGLLDEPRVGAPRMLLDSSGQIQIAFTAGSAGNALVNGIEVNP